jgi:hypothetical protein
MKATKRTVLPLFWLFVAVLQLLFAAQLAPAKSIPGLENRVWKIFPLAVQIHQLDQPQVSEGQRKRAPPTSRIASDDVLGPEINATDSIGSNISIATEQPRNALGQFMPINPGDVPSGFNAVEDFANQAQANGFLGGVFNPGGIFTSTVKNRMI